MPIITDINRELEKLSVTVGCRVVRSRNTIMCATIVSVLYVYVLGEDQAVVSRGVGRHKN